ncbi:Hypothetical predicted protein [Olea europaea subsp. europaea]|uniref:protein-serine/threonine phosphatase n=1 Tax=Olea europaea subsp. europaea TaxID=158383 RepID=A0A8S0US35_OLEEU|nr:Hypothetical predicted protein [Olea europaea subsp. europaea]
MAAPGQGMEPAVLDDIINRLLEFRSTRTVRQVQLSENEIRALCTASREIFLSQPNLLELEAPIKICGVVSFGVPEKIMASKVGASILYISITSSGGLK